jgi:arylsulfatase A-like enzyme
MDKKPNILIILSDQLRRDKLSIYGDPNISTPNIDRLADEGVRFQNACSSYPICVPFRFTFMTGEYAHTRFVPAIEWRMSPAERTLADEFNEAGYHTIYIGKWHLYGGHSHLPKHPARKANLTPVPRKFQGRWQKWLAFEIANNPFDTYYFEDDDPTPRHIDTYQTDGLFDIAMDYLKTQIGSNKPFCCVLSVEPPHFPLIAPKDLERKWKKKDLKLPPNFLFQDKYPPPGLKINAKSTMERRTSLKNLKKYYAMVENLELNVGRMLDFLEKTGLKKDTIIIFLSDHGEMGGTHCVSNIIKDHPYEESVGIPLIIVDPRTPELAGNVITDPVCTEDLFPTILGLVGLKPKQEKHGLDLTPIIHGKSKYLSREGILLEFVHDLRPGDFPAYNEKFWRGIRSNRYKYTVLGDAEEGGKPWQFFDLENDPYEMENLIDDPNFKNEIIEHHKLLRKLLVETGDHYVLATAHGIEGLNLWKD